MGMSATATLSYGVDIGIDDDGFGFVYDDPNRPEWVKDHGELLYDVLKDVCGKYGLGFVAYGNNDFTGYILAAEVCGGLYYSERIEIPDVSEDASERLRGALESLGLDPAKHTPCWHISAFYG